MADKTATDALFQKLLNRAFKEPGASDRSNHNAVRGTQELRRIINLPMRTLDLARAPTELLTAALRTPNGTWKLKPVQAAALEEMHDFGGMLGIIGVGRGKTLISYLAPEVMELQRPLLLVPAALQDETRRRFAVLRDHWMVRREPNVVSYTMLGLEHGQKLLERLKPDGIIADECHKLKNPRAAVTKCVGKWMVEHPETRFVGMSGTVISRSILEFAHISFWCLRGLSPVPTKWREVQDWSYALDEKVPDDMRMDPGALEELASEEDAKEWMLDRLGAARRAFKRRLISTPGVVATVDDMHPASINISCVDPYYETPEKTVESAFLRLRNSWETPDGWEISDAATMWRHEQELACGFYYKWDPRPPDWWLEPRQEWSRFVRHTIGHNRRNLNSEKQVASACVRGELNDEPHKAWTKVRKEFVPNQVAVWVSDRALRFCKTWLETERGICWVYHRAFGAELERLSGIPYFSNEGLDSRGRTIESMAGKPVIASIASNATGRDLQAWHRNLVVCPPTKGDVWEQLLGRTHRDGQRSDEIEVDVVLACKGQLASFEQAIADARFIESSTGQPQKLLYATMANIWDPETVAHRRGARW